MLADADELVVAVTVVDATALTDADELIVADELGAVLADADELLVAVTVVDATALTDADELIVADKLVVADELDVIEIVDDNDKEGAVEALTDVDTDADADTDGVANVAVKSIRRILLPAESAT